jgi:WD40 repeat protein
MVFSPDSQQLAYLTGDSLINIWSVNKLLARLTSGAASQTFSCITTTSDGKLLASSMPKGPVRVWVKERKIYRVLLTIDIEPAASLAFSLNSTRLAIMSLNGTVKVVDIPSGNSVLELQYEHYHRQAFSPDSQSLALLTTVRRMEVHDLRTKSVSEVPCSKNLDKIAFSPDSKSLAGTSLHTYNIFSGRGWKLRSRTPTRAWAVALSPDGRWLACALWYVNITFSDIRLFDMTDGGAFYAKYGPVHMLKRLAFSNDGRRLIVEDDKFSVETHTVPEKPAATPAPQAGPPVHFDLDREWLSYMGRRILWVPPEFREPHCHAVHDHGFVWADESGSVQHVEFNISVMGEAGGWPPAEALHNKWKRVGPLRQINYALGSFGI